MGAPRISFFAAIWEGPSEYFLRLLNWAPWDQFLCIPWGALRPVSSTTVWGPPRSVSSLTMWGPPQVFFFVYYMGTPSDQFLRLLYGGSLRPVSWHTMLGPPQINFFAYYMGSPDRFFYFLRVKLSLGAPILFNLNEGGKCALLTPPHWKIIGGLFVTFFSLWGAFFTMLGSFCYFLLHGGGLFLGLPSPPYENFCGRPWTQPLTFHTP